MNFFYVYGIVSYPLFLYIAIFMIGRCLSKRKKFFLFGAIFSLMSIAGEFFLYHYLVDVMTAGWENQYLITCVRVACSTINFLIAFVLLVLCFERSLSSYIYCLVCGICLQHFSQQTGKVIYESANIKDQAIEFSINLITYIIVYSLYFLYLYKKGKRIIRIDEKKQFVVASLLIMVAIYAMPFATTIKTNEVTAILFSILSAIVALLGLLLENQLVQYKAAELENAANRKLIEEQKKQYQIDKAIIDKLNIKAHDLRHQLENGLPIENEHRNDVLSIIKAYDSIYHTGNEALDMVLSKTSLRYQKQNITLTCMANGESLSFLKNEEIYSLFGNILDNAYESVTALENQNKRLISLIVFEENGVITIKETNYYTGSDDLNTHKEDRLNHGFGLISIKQIVEQYNGKINITKKDGIFTIKIHFFNV